MRAAVVAYLSEWVRWLSSPRRAPQLGPNPVTYRAQELGIVFAGVPAAARRRSGRRSPPLSACSRPPPSDPDSVVQIESSRGVNRKRTGQPGCWRGFAQKPFLFLKFAGRSSHLREDLTNRSRSLRF
jgi:hypothetical protein